MATLSTLLGVRKLSSVAFHFVSTPDSLNDEGCVFAFPSSLPRTLARKRKREDDKKKLVIL